MPRGVRNKNKNQKPAELDEVSTIEADDTGSDEMSVTEVSSQEGAHRVEAGKTHVQEKTTDKEKDTAPLIIVSWNDASGRRRTKQYTCASLRIQEHKSEEIGKATHKTLLDISIDANVIEVI